MRISRLDEGERFDPPGHVGVGPLRLQGGSTTPTEHLTVALSHYLPGAQAGRATQETETIYVVVSGHLVMESEGVEAELGTYDSVHFSAGTVRTVENRTNLPATMLVIRPRP